MTDYYVDEEYEGGYGDDDGLVDDPPEGPGRRIGLPRRPRRQRAERPPVRFDEVEGLTTWMYLGLLGALFLILVLFSWACDVEPTTPTDLLPTGDDTSSEVGEVAVRLTVTVDGDIVRLAGAVPDEAAHQQVFEAAAELYGQQNVIDEIVVDGATTVDGGVLTMSGSAEFDDDRPQQLRDRITSGLGLTVGDFSVSEGDVVVDAVALTATLDGGTVRFAGTIPDDASAVELTAAGEAIWGAGSVDTSGLTVGDTTWTEATVTVTGSAAPGDTRHEQLVDELRTRFGNLVEVDTSGVTSDISTEAVTAADTAIAEALAAQSITFGQNSADIDASSDDVLATIAEQLQSIPGVPVEVVGHTDDLGPDDENLALSQLRAEAVVSRLVELGVEEGRLTARGAGEAEPIADNGTSAGRAQNRRIEFVISGA